MLGDRNNLPDVQRRTGLPMHTEPMRRMTGCSADQEEPSNGRLGSQVRDGAALEFITKVPSHVQLDHDQGRRVPRLPGTPQLSGAERQKPIEHKVETER